MISGIGITVYDIIMVLDGFSSAEGSYYCDEILTEGGGMAATALCAASKLGANTRIFTRIGDDRYGEFLLDEFHRYGVDTAGVVTVPGKRTTQAVVFVDENTGEKQFYSEQTKPAFTDTIPLDCSLLEGTRVLLVDGHWIEGAQAGAEWAHSRGIPVVGDFKRKYPGLENLLPYVDYLIIPSFFARELTGKTDEADMLEKLATLGYGIPVITCGEQGGVYFSHDEIRRYRTFPVKCVDSTGAGDAFHGAFCHFLANGLEIDECLELASAVGALNCRTHGGRQSLPSRKELAAFLKAHGVETNLP